MKLKFIILALGVSIVLIWSCVIEPNQVFVHEETVVIDRLPTELDGMRIGILSDLHVGAPHITLEKLAHIVRLTTQSHPDLIVLLGDYVIQGVVGGHFVAPEPIAAAAGLLQAPLGVYAVLGNHDWWYDGVRIERAFQQVGIPVLENASVKLVWHGKVFWLVGVADALTRKPDISKALTSIPSGEFIIGLTHNPDIFPEVPSSMVLTLAGHTHGGQVYLPIFGRPIVPSKFGRRYAIGHIQEGAKHLFVTPGIGTSILPIRFGVPPEITVLTLRSH